MNWLLENGTPDEAAELCDQLYVWWMSVGMAEELGVWAQCAYSRGTRNELLAARLALIVGRVHGRKDRFAESDEMLQIARRKFQAAGDNDGVIHALSSLIENLVHESRLLDAVEVAGEITEITNDSGSHEVKCRALHARCWLEGSLGNHKAAIEIGLSLASEAHAAGLVEFEAKTLADLAWIGRSCGEYERALKWAQNSSTIAHEAATGGAVVSACTELAYAYLCLGRVSESIEAVRTALIYRSGDDLSPSSVQRLALALAVGASMLEDKETELLANNLVAVAASANQAIGVWVGDQQLVEERFKEIMDRSSPALLGATQVEVVRTARKVALHLGRIGEASQRSDSDKREPVALGTDQTSY